MSKRDLVAQVMTVVSGPYVREIFLNNDFNFVHGINKVYFEVLNVNAAG